MTTQQVSRNRHRARRSPVPAAAWVTGAVLLIVAVPAADATRTEVAQSRLCRGATAKNSLLMVGYALRALDDCHRRVQEGRATSDCNVTGTAFADPALSDQLCGLGNESLTMLVPTADTAEVVDACRGVLRANSGISASFACPVTTPVLQNYPASAITTTGDQSIVKLASNVLGPSIISAVGDSGAQLQGGGVAGVRGRVRGCRNAIGRTRTRIVTRVVRADTACQKRVDARATTFGGIASSCLSEGRFRDDVAKLGKACRGVNGADVGSCSDLPSCVRDSAVATGNALARFVYGGATVCGNGVKELGEECDDGNTDETDDCTTACTLAVCGDGFVHAGAEECDDGNQFQTDSCLNDCKVPFCGDGMVNGNEECDDGNIDPTDGCDNCRNAVTCQGGSVTASLQLFDDMSTGGKGSRVAGVRLDLRYPIGLSIPGSSFETDDTRLAILTGIDGSSIFVDRDSDNDGLDDTARVVYVITGGRTFGIDPFAAVTFDCEAGTLLNLQSFTCSLLDAAGATGFTLDGISCGVVALK